jgi:O-methyltransferase involved in polyketide biosynthesis
VRPRIFEVLLNEALEGVESPLIVEIASGLSSRGVTLVAQMPQAEYIEIDLPDVIQAKRERLQKARDVKIPSNLTWREADLGVVPLAQLLDGRQADAILAEGLLSYFVHAEILHILSNILASLKPGGHFIAELGNRVAIDKNAQVTRFFARQAGTFKGTVESPEAGEKLFATAGFDDISYRLPSKMGHLVGEGVQADDLAIVYRVRKPTSESKASQPPAESQPDTTES